MNWHIAGFLICAVLLLSRLIWLIRRSGTQQAIPTSEYDRWSWKRLTIASFLTLFGELALIRWMGAEVRIFAYVKNLTLLLCFLGFGLGCALARRPVRWRASATALLGLLLVVRWPWHGEIFENLSSAMGAGQDIQIWASGTVRHWPAFLGSVAIVAVLLLLVVCVFIPLGQVVSRQLELAARPLQGYSWNLAASLVGNSGIFRGFAARSRPCDLDGYHFYRNGSSAAGFAPSLDIRESGHTCGLAAA